MALASVLQSHSGGLWRWLRFYLASCSGHWLGPEPWPTEDLAPCGILSALECVGGVASVPYFLTLPRSTHVTPAHLHPCGMLVAIS